jgi:hypothetical protein
VFYTRYKQLKFRSKIKRFKPKLNELFTSLLEDEDDEYNTTRLLKTNFQIFVNVTLERKKPKLGRNIQREYMEKVLMYGYVMVNKFNENK